VYSDISAASCAYLVIVHLDSGATQITRYFKLPPMQLASGVDSRHQLIVDVVDSLINKQSARSSVQISTGHSCPHSNAMKSEAHTPSVAITIPLLEQIFSTFYQ